MKSREFETKTELFLIIFLINNSTAGYSTLNILFRLINMVRSREAAVSLMKHLLMENEEGEK